MRDIFFKRYFLVGYAYFISLSVFLFAFSFPFPSILALLFMVGIMGAYVYINEHKHKERRLRKIWPISATVLCIAMLPFLLDGLKGYYNWITAGYQKSSVYVFVPFTIEKQETELGLIMLILFLIISAVQLYALDYTLKKKRHLLFAFFITLIPMLPTFLYSLPQPWFFTGLLLAFWVYLLFLTIAKRHKAKVAFYQKPFICILLICALFTISFLIVYPESAYKQSASSATIRRKLLQNIDGFFNTLNNGESSVGKVDLNNAQDRYYTGNEQLKVEMKTPTSLYLKTFSGATYRNNAWESLEEGIYQGYTNIEWDRIPVWLASHKYAHVTSTQHIKISDFRDSKKYAITPYDVILNTATEEMNAFYDAYHTYKDEKTIVTDYVVGGAESATDVSEAKKDGYYDFVKKNYAGLDQYTSEMVQRLGLRSSDYFIIQNDKGDKITDQEAVIAYVKDFIQNRTSYTLQPGKTPADKEFITYFLKENKKGYCVHYATAATVLLRYYGIPARYVEGFYVDSALFLNGIASVPDRSAHAWVEVFDAIRGWIPIEVTPAAQVEQEETPIEETPKDEQETPLEEQTPQDTPVKRPETNTPIDNKQDANSPKQFVIPSYVYALCSVLFLLTLPYLQRKVRYGIRWLIMHRKNRKKAVRSIYQYALKTTVYGVEVPASIKTTYEKALFSRHSISEEEYKAFYRAVHENVAKALKHMSKKQKIKFLYICAYR